MGPNGDPVTRGFPIIENVPGETSDHVWHRGLYSAYGEVNDVDNWTEGEGRGHTVHREFEALESGPVYRPRHRPERLDDPRQAEGAAGASGGT